MSRYKNILKRILIILVTTSIIAPNSSTYVFAGQDDTQIYKDKIDTLTVLLGRILNDSYNDAKKQIKEEIVAHGWDYSMTMTSFENMGNPYKDMDYVELLSCYMTIKDEYQDLIHFKSISNIPFISFTSNETSFSENSLEKVDLYEEVGEGKYVRSGYEYTDEIVTVDNFEKGDDGFYVKKGTKTITPKLETITYGEITLKSLTVDELLDIYGLNTVELHEKIKLRSEKLDKLINNDELSQTLFTKTPDYYLPEAAEDYVRANMTAEQKNLITVAQSLIGQVPYRWGGKSSFAGYDNTWWTYDDNNLQRGLDCSGYVQWIFRTAGYPEEMWKKLLSTSSTLGAGFQDITKDELQVGDVGLLHKTSSEGTNHIGMYIGDGKWIHCSSGKGTVAVTNFNFRKFLRIIDSNNYISPVTTLAQEKQYEQHLTEEQQKIKEKEEKEKEEKQQEDDRLKQQEEAINGTQKDKSKEKDEKPVKQEESEPVIQSPVNFNDNINDSDVLLLAQLISHEARSEGMNGWIAVGEVVLNRVHSTRFPNTLQEVIFQKKQFASAGSITGITPSEEILNTSRMLLKGQVSIFNNSEVLYFRNPTITNGIAASEKVNWGSHAYYTNVGHHAFYLQ